MVNKNLVWILVAVIGYAGWYLLTNKHLKYSTEAYWETATLEDVANVPQEALEGYNKNGPVLMWAASTTSDPRIITALVERGADVNGSDSKTYVVKNTFTSTYTVVDDNNITGTPLSAAAAESDSPKVIAELVRLGAEVNSRHTNDFTPLMIAATWNTNADITRELIKHGADIRLTNKFGETALESAKSQDNQNVIAVLENLFAGLEPE